MENKINKKQSGLLPGYFKIVGLIIIALLIIAGIVKQSLNLTSVHLSAYWARVFAFDMIIIGLTFIAASRDKIEDERTAVLRLRSMAWAFTWVILLVFLEPFTSLLFTDPPEKLTAYAVVLNMLVGYITSYYCAKLGFGVAKI